MTRAGTLQSKRYTPCLWVSDCLSSSTLPVGPRRFAEESRVRNGQGVLCPTSVPLGSRGSSRSPRDPRVGTVSAFRFHTCIGDHSRDNGLKVFVLDEVLGT